MSTSGFSAASVAVTAAIVWCCSVVVPINGTACLFIYFGYFSCQIDRVPPPLTLTPQALNITLILSCASSVLLATPLLAPWGRCRAKGNVLPQAVEPARVGAGKEFTLLLPQAGFDSLKFPEQEPTRAAYR